MVRAFDSELSAGVSSAGGRPAGYPFRGPGLLARVGPFAVIAVLAEASLGLPPGPVSAGAAVASVVLLVAVAAAFLLPWPRLPGWMPVLVPLAYAGSVLGLILASGAASGAASGVGIVILVPLIWTALFGRLRESACVVAAIVAAEVVISLAPAAVPDAVIARRVILWAALGAVLSVATHGLRDRIGRAREQAARLQDRLREVSIIQDRDRIAGDLQDTVIQRIFAAGLSLQSAAMRTADRQVRRQIEKSVDDLDDAVVILRDAVYGLGRRREGCGLREEILRLCEELHLAPGLSFSGPVDAALPPGVRPGFVELLRESLGLIGQHFAATRIEITASGDSYAVVVQARPLAGAAGITAPSGFPGLRDRAARAGIGIDIEPGPGSTRFAWHLPIKAPR